MHKNIIKFFVLAITIVSIFVISFSLIGCNTANNYDTQILVGSSNESSMFNYSTITDMQEQWDLNPGGGSNSTVFSTGPNGLNINTTVSGYALASQRIMLKSFSYYKIEYDYSITQMTNFNEESDYHPGLFVGFLEDPLFNVIGDKKAQETSIIQNGHRVFYFHTGGTREYNLSINVGNEDYPVKGIATIKSILLTRVTPTVAIDASENSLLLELRPSVFGQTNQSNSLFVILGGIGTLLIAYFAYILRSRDMSYEQGLNLSKNKFYDKIKNSKYLGILITLSIAFLVRISVMLIETLIASGSRISETYFGYYLENLSAQGTWIAKYGTPYFYKYNATSAFLPIPLYFSALSGLIGQGLSYISGFDGNMVGLAVVATNKMFSIIADLVSVVFIYKIIEKNQGKTAATIMASLYSLMPIIFALSSAWGAIESLASMFIIISFYYILNRNYIAMASFFFLACVTSAFAIYLSPAVLFYTFFLIVDALKKKKYKDVIAPIIGIVAGFVLFYLITLPFTIIDIKNGDTFIAFDRILAVIKGGDFYSLNSFNFQGLLKNNFVSITTQSKVVDIIFILFILLVFAFVYFKTRNRLNLTLIGAGTLITLWTFSNNMRPELLTLALPLLFIVTILLKEIRLYIAFALYSAFTFVNNAYLYLVAGYDTKGVVEISYENNAIIYVFGAISLLLVIYVIIIGYDVIVNKKVVIQKPIKVTYFSYASRISKNVFVGLSNVAIISSAWLKEFFLALKQDIKDNKQKRIDKAQERKQLNNIEQQDEEQVDPNDSNDIKE